MSTKNPDTVRISKEFSYLLRHSAHEHKSLKLRADGFVKVSSILNLPKFRKSGIDFEFVRRMVNNDTKTRFSLLEETGVWYIRANQGHSQAVASKLDFDQLLTRIETSSEIPIAIHGTTRSAWEMIRIAGLSRMSRSHIHLSVGIVGIDSEVQSGMRLDSSIHIYIDTTKAMAAGIPFFRSANNVILSPGIDGIIPVKFFSKVVDVKSAGSAVLLEL